MAKLVSAPRQSKIIDPAAAKAPASSASNILGLVLVMAFVAIAIWVTVGAFHVPGNIVGQ